MNKDVRRYFNKLGMLYKRFIQGGGYFGVRFFTIIDEYYFNDRHYDTQYRVGINLGKFKSMSSSRADIEISLYIKEALILVDHISKILTNSKDGDIAHYSQKGFCYRDNGNLKLEVESLVLIKRRNINDYAFGIVYRDFEGQVIDRFQIDLDRYDLIELHNLLRSFSQTSYNLIINLAVNNYYSQPNSNSEQQSTAYNADPSFMSNQGDIPISIENVSSDELNIDEIDSFGLKVPNLTSIDIKIDQETLNNITSSNIESVKDKIIEPSDEIDYLGFDSNIDSKKQESSEQNVTLSDFKNDLFCDIAEHELPDENSDEIQKENNVEIQDPKIDETTAPVNEQDESEYINKFGEGLFNIIKSNYKYTLVNEHKTIVLDDLDQETIIMFEKTLLQAINIIRNYNLSAFQIKPAFILLFNNIDIKETLHRLNVSYDDRGVFYLLQAMLLTDRTKTDDIIFNQEQQNLMSERVAEMLEIQHTNYTTRFNTDSEYHNVINQHF